MNVDGEHLCDEQVHEILHCRPFSLVLASHLSNNEIARRQSAVVIVSVAVRLGFVPCARSSVLLLELRVKTLSAEDRRAVFRRPFARGTFRTALSRYLKVRWQRSVTELILLADPHRLHRTK